MGEAAAALDWRALAAPLQTVVFYMGAAQLPQIVARLVEQGAPPARPVAVIEQATLPGQRVISRYTGRDRRRGASRRSRARRRC